MSKTIVAERVLLVIECLCGEGDQNGDIPYKVVDQVYRFAHVGTQPLRVCTHPDWDAEFIEVEKRLLAANRIPNYEKRLEEIRTGEFGAEVAAARKLFVAHEHV